MARGGRIEARADFVKYNPNYCKFMNPLRIFLLAALVLVVFGVGNSSAELPDLEVSPSDIELEIDGVIGNASQLKDGDTVVIITDIKNIGDADADGTSVEIFYYPENPPESDSEKEDLVADGFVFDEQKNNYIFSLYNKTINITSNETKTIFSNDWYVKQGVWKVAVRLDYDKDLAEGNIEESLETNNYATYPELLILTPNLVIDAMRVDSKYAGNPASNVPNINDMVTFTVTVSNRGGADVRGAHLYITADSSADNEIIKDRTNRDYVDFDIDAGETIDVRLRWKATEEEWTAFRAEINPVCEDYNIQSFECESEGDGFAAETGHMFHESGGYSDNVWPRTGVFEQDGAEVRFEILPDFIIKKIDFYPTDFQVGQSVEITVTVENIGNADWQISYRPLMVIFEDGTGYELHDQVYESINKDDTTEVVIFWEVPRQGNLVLTFTIDAGSGNFEVQQCNDCGPANSGDGTDNDEYSETITVGPSGNVLPSEGKVCTDDGEIENADDGCNQCMCKDGEWICTSVECSDDSDTSLPSISLIISIISIGLLAIFRRK